MNALVVYIEETDELGILDYADEDIWGPDKIFRLETSKGKEYFSENYFKVIIYNELIVIGSL